MATTRTFSALPTGSALSKLLVCMVEGRGSINEARKIALQRCKELPQVDLTLDAMIAKNAVGGSTMASGGAPLAQYGIGQEFFQLLMSASIFGRLAPVFRKLPFRVKSSRELGAGVGGAWVGEGLPIPVRSATFDLIALDWSEVDAIIVLTKELFQFNPVAEADLRAAVIAGLARYLDGQLLDPSVSATATHPASLTNGAEVVTSSGSTAANIIADLESLLAAIKTPGDGLRWVMRRTTFARIAAKLAGVGLSVGPDSLLGIPVVGGSTSPQQVALIDGAAVAYAADDSVEVSATTNADVQMSDAPSQDGTTGTGAQMVSLYQSNLVGVRAGLAASWQHTAFNAGSPSQPAGVAYMTVSY